MMYIGNSQMKSMWTMNEDRKKECMFCGKKCKTEKVHKTDEIPPKFWCEECDQNDDYLNI